MLVKHLSVVFISLLLVFNLSAQNYYAVKNTGTVPLSYKLDKVYEVDKTILLNQYSNDIISVKAEIPFPFYFYQSPVSKYVVSDNGYLSFDTGIISAEVPDTNLPLNSIVGFGTDLKLQKLPPPNEGIGTQVFSYTVGEAPNRRHIIQYYGLSMANDPLDKPINNASIYAFAIVLHEGTEGRFDIVYSPYGDKTKLGAIGCRSQDGNSKLLLNDSLSPLPFQYSFDVSNFIVYQFRIGVQPEYDLVIKEMKLDKIFPVNSVVNFSGLMSNWGKKTIHSYYINYSVNAGDTISHLIDQQNLLPSGQGNMNFTHPISWLSGASGSLNDINVWLSQPDNDTDGLPENSHFSQKVLRNNNNNSIQRNILIEEGTGAWCGYCPEAHLLLAEARKLHGNRVIPVAYHFDDSMSNPDAYEFLDAYVSSYPDALIDRKIFLGSNNTWLNEINSRLQKDAPVEVRIEMKTFNPQTREISYRVVVRFTDYWYGIMRIGSIVTERSVRGNASPNIWSQNNFYSKFHSGGVSGSAHPLYNELEYMDGYLHKNVQNENPRGVWGVDGILPELVTPNSEYSADFTYSIPPERYVYYTSDNNTEYCSTIDIPGQNEGGSYPANIELVGYIAEYDEDPFKRPVLNAVSEPLWDLTSLPGKTQAQVRIQLFPNPVSGECSLILPSDWVGYTGIQILNQEGKVIPECSAEFENGINGVYRFNTSALASGVYTVRVTGNNGIYSEQLLIFQ